MGGLYGQEYCLWIYQPLNDLYAKWFALLNQTDAVVAMIPPRKLAESLIKETNHDSLPRAAFAALLLEQHRIRDALKNDEEARRLIVSELNRTNDEPLRYDLLRTQAGFYNHRKDGSDDVGKAFLDRFQEAGEELAAKPVADYDTFALAGSWFDLQNQHSFSTQDITARVVLRMLVFDAATTRRVVLLFESDKTRFPAPGIHIIGGAFRNEWVAAVNEYLKSQIEADPSAVSPAVVGTIGEFLRSQKPDEEWDTPDTAKLLTPLLEKHFAPGVATVDDSSPPIVGQVQPSLLLSTILHCGGEIPSSMINGGLLYSAGPFESGHNASPFHFVKSAIESTKVPGDESQFVFPDGVDILTFLAVADHLAGASEEIDEKIAAFLETYSSRSIDDGVAKAFETASSQKFLKRLEQKTRTDTLRDVVRKLILPPVELASPEEN